MSQMRGVRVNTQNYRTLASWITIWEKDCICILHIRNPRSWSCIASGFNNGYSKFFLFYSFPLCSILLYANTWEKKYLCYYILPLNSKVQLWLTTTMILFTKEVYVPILGIIIRILIIIIIILTMILGVVAPTTCDQLKNYTYIICINIII